MASLKERVTARLARLRERYGWLDHVVRMVQHYGAVNGNAQAGAVTFFGFLAVFPILALAFFVVGQVAKVDPSLKGQMVHEINGLLPGVIGNRKGQVPLTTFEDYAGTVGLIGLVGILYSGLGWLSGMRSALEVMFVTPRKEQPNFLFGKLRDLGTLCLVGLTLVVSVALSGAVTGFSGRILDAVGIDPQSVVPAVLLSVLGHALAIVASTVLLLTMFKLLLVHSHLPRRSLQSGAVLGAVGFEVLKVVANLLLRSTQGSPAFQAFGVALILVVWINYFSRLVMYAAAWSYTAPRARELREAEALVVPGAALAEAAAHRAEAPRSWTRVLGVSAALAAVALVVRRKGGGPS
jgi:membrane protein